MLGKINIIKSVDKIHDEIMSNFDNKVNAYEILIHDISKKQSILFGNNNEWLKNYVHNKYYEKDFCNDIIFKSNNIIDQIHEDINIMKVCVSNNRNILDLRKQYNMENGVLYIKKSKKIIYSIKFFLKNNINYTEILFINDYINQIRILINIMSIKANRLYC